MESPNDRPPSEQPRPAEPPPSKKRFQIVKLEERIAPTKPEKSLSSGTERSGSGSFY
jgi:hypothetical protein